MNKNNNNKIYCSLLTIVFLTFIGVTSLINLLAKDREFSEQENRNLSGNPEFSFSSLVSGDYVKKYESYISDQFPGREFFVKLKSNINSLGGKDSSNKVFIGKNNQLLEDFQRRPDEETDEKVSAINGFADKHKNINTSLMLVPTATKILEEYLPRYAPVDDQLNYIDDVKVKLSPTVKFIDTYDALSKSKDKYLYYRTDHHWTSNGAYIAYKELCRELSLEPRSEEEFSIELVANDFYGSLSSKIGTIEGQPDSINIYFPKPDNELVVNYVDEQKKVPTLYSSESLDKKDKYEVFTGGNHPHINIKSLADKDKKLLVIKDSFANSMLPFLTSHYGEIDVVDLRYYMEDIEKLIESKEITDILFLYNVNTFNEDDSILNLNME
ncbi:MAG: DHHW family protein [Clostridium sp.]|uniref:DHHW family protein n=1 Tax=Clostridium sp. TaxID=1506 RepID=UPI0030275050